MAETRKHQFDAPSSCRGRLIAVGAFSVAINLLVLTVSVYMLLACDCVLPRPQWGELSI